MKLTLNGASVHVATGGKDFDAGLPTILCLHGSGGDHRTWAQQSRWFAYHGFSVIAPDLPGHSLSGGQAFTAIEQSGPWLEGLLDALDVKRAHIIGHSQGFLSALELYKTAPQKCVSLAAVATAAAIPVNQALIDTAQSSADKAAQMMCNWGFGPSAHMGRSSVPGMQPIAISRAIMAANPLAVDLQACADYQGGMEIIKSLKIPLIGILGDKDKMTPIKGGLAMIDAAPKAIEARASIIKNGGHMLPLEAPKELLYALTNYIKSL